LSVVHRLRGELNERRLRRRAGVIFKEVDRAGAGLALRVRPSAIVDPMPREEPVTRATRPAGSKGEATSFMESILAHTGLARCRHVAGQCSRWIARQFRLIPQ
jgi:hypothetical protein